MAQKIFFSLIALLIFITPGSPKEVAGVDMPDTFKAGDEQLILNGAGLREKYAMGVDIYVAGLYLKGKTSDAMKIINANEPMAIKIVIVSGLVTPKKFITATDEGFDEATRNLGINKATIQKEIDKFNDVFLKGIKKGNVYDIVYTPANGIQVYTNGKAEPGATTKSMTYKRAMFGIWLTKRSEKYMNILGEGMLGK